MCLSFRLSPAPAILIFVLMNVPCTPENLNVWVSYKPELGVGPRLFMGRVSPAGVTFVMLAHAFGDACKKYSGISKYQRVGVFRHQQKLSIAYLFLLSAQDINNNRGLLHVVYSVYDYPDRVRFLHVVFVKLAAQVDRLTSLAG
jgi:hypothetical protein